jgi:hypothetical protein
MTIREVKVGHEYMITWWRRAFKGDVATVTDHYTIQSRWPWWVCAVNQYGKAFFIRRGAVESIWEIK